MVPPLTVIGAGRVGKTLARCLHQHNLVTIVDIVARRSENAIAAVQFIGAGKACDSFNELAHADIFMLTVPDDQITSCCAQLAASGRLSSTSTVFHCSGALPAAVMVDATRCGAAVASLHPVRSFADPAHVAEHFIGTYFGIEGDAAALKVLLPMFNALGARTVALHPSSKTLYHAAAVFASNYIVTVLAAARDAYVAAGIPADIAIELMAPLTTETIQNVWRLGPEAALTGPVARGDTDTVAHHQQALFAWNPSIGSLYQQLAEATRTVAAHRAVATGTPAGDAS